ncbi:phosphoribosylamine--glycine ligase [Methanolinea mesophila]|nr:phosphoribosylamine--glycine ligase [Methanolinea mesophila]
MNVLVVGGGGREHAIVRALASDSRNVIFSVMAKRNPGIAGIAREVLIEKETNVPAVVRFALTRGVEYAVIGPEAPLETGIVDALEDNAVGCMGPSRAAARLETDKAFCREMMNREGVAGCPKYRVFHDPELAAGFILDSEEEFAIKPIGLTGGKGVKIMGEHLDREEAGRYVRQLGGEVVIEERLIGEEFTLQAFTDGKTLVPMPLVQDHKRAFEGDQGPNTGGMGSYSMEDHSLPFVSENDREKALEIMYAAVHSMARLGQPYKGVIYGQFMNTARGPMVIEFNARFGDPEAMNVLSILESDFSEIVAGIAECTLSSRKVEFSRKATVCKYIVPSGYPETPNPGEPFSVHDYGNARLYYANVEEREGMLYTQTSRTMAFVGIADTLSEAETIAEHAAGSVKGPVRHRKDIGTADLLARRCAHMKEIR